MNQILHFFDSNPLLNIIFFILSIVSIILAFIFYFKSIRNKKPIYNIETNRLVSNNLTSLSKIEIKYNNSPVSNLSVTKIALWNNGKESIRRNDIASSDPIIIKTKDNVLLYDFEVVYEKAVNVIVVEKESENSLKISFEFLDFNDGVVLNIYHSGNRSDNIKISGTLIGSEKISQAVIKDYISDKFDIISNPVNYLVNSEKKIYRFVGWTIAAPITFIIIFPLLLITLPTDKVLEFFHKVPKEYKFSD
ncbi:hypothetical protein [Flavobacterium sp.]|uniref:hypothetical protein n=1 Tax=Flavobacterium sp. TaxID=239 RepID=UPI0038FD1930